MFKLYKLLLCLTIIVVSALESHAGITDALVDIDVQKRVLKRNKEKFQKKSYGKGYKTTEEMQITVVIKNTTRDELKNLRIVAFPIAERNEWTSNDRDIDLYITAIEREDIDSLMGYKEEILVFQQQFEAWETKKGNVLWRGGTSYGGVGVKVFHNGELIEDKISGSIARSSALKLMDSVSYDEGERKSSTKKKKS
ncbi:MAG: hypothetical protein AAGA18_08050 [Verrucomicrobiota bacterium]